MHHIKLLLLLACLSCLSLHCKKDDEEKLPPATTSGKQTFGCKINGKVWVTHAETQVQYWNGTLQIISRKGDLFSGTSESIALKISNGLIKNVGAFTIQNTDSRGDFSAYVANINYEMQYLPNAQAVLIITRLDTIQGYVAGQFNFSACNKEKTSFMSITDGRFDFKYK